MEKAYGELDKEEKGFLTFDELADKFLALGATLSKGDLISLAADIDTDDDKKISKVPTLNLLNQVCPNSVECFKRAGHCLALGLAAATKSFVAATTLSGDPRNGAGSLHLTKIRPYSFSEPEQHDVRQARNGPLWAHFGHLLPPQNLARLGRSLFSVRFVFFSFYSAYVCLALFAFDLILFFPKGGIQAGVPSDRQAGERGEAEHADNGPSRAPETAPSARGQPLGKVRVLAVQVACPIQEKST